MWHQLLHNHQPSGGQVADYSLASALITSPVWATYLSNINLILTFVTLALGAWLAIRRLRRDYRRDKDES